MHNPMECKVVWYHLCMQHLTPVPPDASTRIAKEVRWLLKQVTSELPEAISSMSKPLLDHPPILRGRQTGSRDNIRNVHIAHTALTHTATLLIQYNLSTVTI